MSEKHPRSSKTTNRRVAAGSLAAALAAFSAAVAHAEDAQYGPAPPPTAIGPVSFPAVATTATQGPEGNTLQTRVGTVSVALVVPPSVFSIPLQVTLTAPRAADLRPHLARSGLTGAVLSAVGVGAAKLDGTPIRGRLSREPVSVSFRSPALRPGVRVVHWDGRRGRFVAVPPSHVTISNGALTIRFNRGDQFVILAPAR